MGHVALRVDGRYLQLGIGGERSLEGSATELEPRGVFERVELGHDRVAFRTLDGRWLATRPDQQLNYGVYPEEELTPAAAFEEILWPDGRISLRSCHLTYLRAEASGRVTVNRVEPGPQERLALTPVPTPAIPAQSSAPRATSASPSSSAWRRERMISGTA